MSDNYMTDSDEEEGDFSASEDEWLPEKADKAGRKGGNDAKCSTSGKLILSDPESDEESASDEDGRPAHKKRARSSKGKIQSSRETRKVPPKSKLSALQRQKLYERYRTSSFSGGKTSAGSGNNSDSSGDEHLVNPDQLDLNSDFFTAAPKDESCSNGPKFDCNAGMKLSDSSGEEEPDKESQSPEPDEDTTRKANKKLIAKINQNSQSFVNFEGLGEYNRKIEQAKAHLSSFKAREHVNEGDAAVGDLLAMGEQQPEQTSSKPVVKKPSKKKDDSDSDWEDVEEKEEIQPQQDVQITLDVGTKTTQKKKRNELDVEACIKRIVNREKRENQFVLHKVNILVAIGHGNYVNSILNNTKLLSLALTLIPSQQCYPKDRTNLEYFEQISKYYREIIDLKDRKMYSRLKKVAPLETSLRLQMLTKAAICKRDYVLIFIILLRAIGIQCRLVMSLVVAPKKLPQSELLQTLASTSKGSTKGKLDPEKEEPKLKATFSSGKSSKKKSPKEDHDYEQPGKAKSTSTKRKPSRTAKIPQLDGNDDSGAVPNKKAKLAASKQKPSGSKGDRTRYDSSSKLVLETPLKSSTSQLQEICMFSPRKTRKQRNDQANRSASVTELNNSKPTMSSPKASSSSTILVRKDYKDKPSNPVKLTEQKQKAVRNVKPSSSTTVDQPKSSASSTVQSTKSNIQLQAKKTTTNPQHNHKNAKAIVPKKAANTNSPNTSNKPTSSKVKKPSPPTDVDSPRILKIEYIDKNIKRRLDRRVLSTDDEYMSKTGESVKPKSGVNLWVEVYTEEEEQWIPVDAINGKVHCREHITKQASSPLVYVLAWNNDGTIKDVSPRYCANYATSTKKLRIEQEWLDETLRKFKGKRTARDIEEDQCLNRALMEQPLPTAIGEYKNHPLYALKRHLLKFEGIYPADAPTLGFIREEPVYARECVHTLHSRELWLKQARTVKLFETAYKVVNARPKYDRASGQMLPAQLLELFGYWQTQDYEPPTAEDGIVPRNAYGNVELFKPCMLPKKTVHLQLPCLNRICKKLGIDCAQAVTGFDFHGGSSHPVYDGFVVCEEYKDIVVDAWYQEQEEDEKREREKFEKRVYGNWRKLIKGLLIRRRLQNKYNFDNL